ncbi:sulfur-oxidizing protein SoxY [Rhodobium orientis]|uniref:Thiosulfate oxidation carrier protein SoxY n=1 Tax=Rhodobium orientis TaxID=34017 RepID=A0A327K0R1_9HYPH|nr:thiosulfate oxidation carrier protein SoxY [Rhodobium orientis]MBB4302250.1 sulfur-oxidizing protein SoxY [Rhodobium orientis]MBK5948961.1 thiosulfate oxidation carrier protein SoxY [Rhodobium orientis]RAI28958.1 thiosulfate oxidation carrier protein SoxY [Rhodobium orientis]
MELTRREALLVAAGGAVAVMAGAIGLPAFAAEGEAQKLIDEFTGGATPESGKISLSAPEIAENGNTVPVGFEIDSPMTADDHIETVMLLAPANPRPGVATFHFTALSGKAAASTRMRLAKTQDLVAVAKTSKGAFYMDTKPVKVTIGGCGG